MLMDKTIRYCKTFFDRLVSIDLQRRNQKVAIKTFENIRTCRCGNEICKSSTPASRRSWGRKPGRSKVAFDRTTSEAVIFFVNCRKVGGLTKLPSRLNAKVGDLAMMLASSQITLCMKGRSTHRWPEKANKTTGIDLRERMVRFKHRTHSCD